MSFAAIGFCAVARIPRPSRVFLTKSVRPIISGIVTAKMAMSSSRSTTFEESPSRFEPSRISGKSLLAAAAFPPPKTFIGAPPQKSAMLTRMKLTPIAATNCVSLGALRSGL